MLGFNFLNIVGTNSFVGNNSDIGLYGTWNTRTMIILEFEQAEGDSVVAQAFERVNGKLNPIGYIGNNGTYGLYVIPNAEGAVKFIPFDTKNVGSDQQTSKFYVGDTTQCVVNDSKKGLILNPNASLATEFYFFRML
jgi:hypothetical protein